LLLLYHIPGQPQRNLREFAGLLEKSYAAQAKGGAENFPRRLSHYPPTV
jgi:hypothetical protein